MDRITCVKVIHFYINYSKEKSCHSDAMEGKLPVCCLTRYLIGMLEFYYLIKLRATNDLRCHISGYGLGYSMFSGIWKENDCLPFGNCMIKTVSLASPFLKKILIRYPFKHISCSSYICIFFLF